MSRVSEVRKDLRKISKAFWVLGVMALAYLVIGGNLAPSTAEASKLPIWSFEVSDLPSSEAAGFKVAQFQIAQIMPRRKPGSQTPKDSKKDNQGSGLMPREKPGSENTADDPREKESQPANSSKDKADKEADKQTDKKDDAESFVWNEGDKATSDTQQIWGKMILLLVAITIFTASVGFAVWNLKWRGWALSGFALTALIFELYALGMSVNIKALSFLDNANAPLALMGLGAAIMIEAAMGKQLPQFYRLSMTMGFGALFLGLLVGGVFFQEMDGNFVKYAVLIAVPFVLYAQVLCWGKSLGRAFSFGLTLLMICVIVTALAPVFINTGPGAPVPLSLHFMFLTSLALLLIPAHPAEEFTEDFYHSGSISETDFGAPRRFAELDGFDGPQVDVPGRGSYDEEPHSENDERYDNEYGEYEEHQEFEGDEDLYNDDEIYVDEEPDEEVNDYEEFDDLIDEDEQNNPEPANNPSNFFASRSKHEGGGKVEPSFNTGFDPKPKPGPRSEPKFEPGISPRLAHEIEPRHPRTADLTAPLPEPLKVPSTIRPAFEEVGRTLEDENRYALGIAGAHQGLWDWTIEGDTLYLSPSVDGMLGLSSGGLKRSEVGWAERIHPDDFDSYRNALRAYIMRGNTAFDMEFRIRHESGDYIWMKLRATCLPDNDGMAARCVGTVADITSAKNTETRLTETAPTDPLTGLASRTTLTDHLGQVIRTMRDPAALPSLIVIDLDRFKTVNDSLGQASGDALLQTVARRLEDVVGASGLVSRLGSDEFAILVYKERGMRPGVIAAKALDALAQPVELDGHEVFPMASLGLAEATIEHVRAEDLLKDAETAMFRAKRQGGGCVEVYESSMTHQTVEALSIETDLRRALERQQMEVFFQPIMDFRTDSVAGFEALLRWRHPTHGLMSPDQFVSIAEANDMIVPLGRFVLSMASLQLSQWQKLFPVSPPLFVSVNVSSRQLKRVDFADDVREVLETARLLPGTLKLEVTESLIQEDPILAENLLQEVKALGAGVVLDDFGTGFASLSNLQRYPFDTIKVDRSFVSTMDTRPDSHVIVNSIVNLANDLGLTVIAEGLESEGDMHRIRQMGCGYGQGFIFGPPMQAHEAQTFIAHHWNI
jgi:diguanylate cyclase (GGDEF)-like protein/PAS domain S-box-containing protein